MSRLVNKTNQRVRQPFMFHYAFFVAYEAVWKASTVTI